MKKEFGYILAMGACLGLASCGSVTSTTTSDNGTTTAPTTEIPTTSETLTTTTETPTTTEVPTTSAEATTTSTTSEASSTALTTTGTLPVPESATIYLAGDSTVKTYEENQYIGGWGQYLDLFLDDSISVVNCAQGGRSSRSFINEGRLYDIDGNNYSFTQNGGKSIASTIQKGDFLFIQFGHNDDDTKMIASGSTNYSTVYDRMVPLGTPDSNGIYPVTEGTKVETTHLPELYTKYATDSNKTNALKETAKYGSTYYAYDSNGTYKWFLKQYIDFARERDVTPVLVTPVSRVKYSGDTIIGGPGLHGENFAYVEAVRQLAKEEDCLLIDLFAETKTMLETATPSYGNYLMALKPNDLIGTWPEGYDTTYGNSALGYTGIEATHYNKYGAYLTAAKVAEAILCSNEVHKEKEAFTFATKVLTEPKKYIAPSNLIAKSKINALENLLTKVKVTDPSRVYPDPALVVGMITELAKKTVTDENYISIGDECETIQAAYNKINVDDRSAVTNYATLASYQVKVAEFELAHKPVAIKTQIFDASTMDTGDYTTTTPVTVGDFSYVGGSSSKVQATSNSFTINGEQVTTSKLLSLGGSASFNNNRYLEFTVTGKCTITVVAKSTSASSDRILNLVKKGNSSVITTFNAKGSMTIESKEIADAGTYQIGSAGSGIYIAYILIEYFE